MSTRNIVLPSCSLNAGFFSRSSLIHVNAEEGFGKHKPIGQPCCCVGQNLHCCKNPPSLQVQEVQACPSYLCVSDQQEEAQPSRQLMDSAASASILSSWI